MTKRHSHWIGGKSVLPDTGKYLESIDPSNGRVVAEIARGNADDAALAVEAADAAQKAWARLPPVSRSRTLHAISDRMRAEREKLAEIERSETGKPAATALADIGVAADYFEFYAALSRASHGSVIDVGPGHHIFTQREPYGVVAIITPWNVPVTQAARSIAPALAMGNTAVLKPSEFTSISSLEMARIASEAGLPDGAFNVVTGTGAECGEPLLRQPAVRKITFTGSVAVGRRVGTLAGERIVSVTLELGGKSPNIVFRDANLEAAARAAVRTLTANAGQICSAGTRLLVDEPIHEQLMSRLSEITKQCVPGRDFGPIITPQQYARVRSYLEEAKDEGLNAVVGGDIPPEVPEGGFYVSPTIFDGVPPDSRIAREEVFGPVLSVLTFADEDEAVERANDTSYGLVAGVWTSDGARALRVASRLQAGQVFVNQWAAPIEAPFGGYKESGFGREKGEEALADYTQVKSVVVNLSLPT